MFWTVVLPSLEAGTWIGWAMTKLTSREQVKELLINGTAASKTFPIVDGRLERATRSANLPQRKAAAGIARGIRYFASTRACELAILKAVQDKWDKVGYQDIQVRLHL